MSRTSIVHLTSAHNRYDSRIFIKMCSSLSKIGYKVSLIVSDNFCNELYKGVSIYNVMTTSESRFYRMFINTRKIFKKAVELDGDIYHLHDPELLPIGIKLKKLGKKVIFDSHEDIPRQILNKHYIVRPLRKFVSRVFTLYENYACSKFDAIVAATPFIRDKFLNINKHCVDINNVPLIDNQLKQKSWPEKYNEVVYIGSISKIRGIEEMVYALEYTDNIHLNLAGKFNEKILEETIKKSKMWGKVNYLGFLEYKEILQILDRSKVGLVVLHPVDNYIDSMPIKLFEYMAAGIPVIASNFPLWREVIETNQCGICVNPNSPEDIGSAINILINNQEKAEIMGSNGLKAVNKKYNWSIEEKKLINLYKDLDSAD